MYKKQLVLLLLVAVTANCDDKCGDSLQCVERELVDFVDKLDKEPSLPLVGDLVVVEKTKDAVQTKKDEGLIERCIRYLASHELKVKMPASEAARSLVEEARTRKLKKLLLPLLLLLKLKAAIVIPAILGVVALVAFKGLGAGLMALTIAGAVGLKSLLESHHHSSTLTYEVVPSSHWSRTGLEAMPQGYHTIP